MIYTHTDQRVATDQYRPTSEVTFSEKNEASLSGKRVAIAAHSNEGPHMTEGSSRYEGQPLKTRKTNRVLASLSAIATGVASALYIIPTATAVGAFATGSMGALLGSIAGPAGLFTGGVIGTCVGAFVGFSVTAYFTPYCMAKAYNRVLEATNDNGFERSKLADRIVAYYEGAASTSRA
ncbi:MULTISPECIES: hypothetical protein [unclassified Endozoicomonas]|uniref:hypothetical protein n=1 Tax=unclassified Endozoicomonas TaxID=2644528 RepID=UPI0021492A38|nr:MULTISPECIES: hypothetical protein [unclassified Endozoicomonas]